MTIEVEDATGLCSLTEDAFIQWARTALSSQDITEPVELAIRIVDDSEGRLLNHTYRGKDYATNVLSFPADIDWPEGPRVLGDLALCWPVIAREAEAQNKTLEQHTAHLVVHGVLHLLGYDHLDDAEAETMEQEEIGILSKLGYPNPYLSQDENNS